MQFPEEFYGVHEGLSKVDKIISVSGKIRG
jgi:hypothetical protein